MHRGYRLALCAVFGFLSLAAGPQPGSGDQAEGADSQERIARSLEAIAAAQGEAVKPTEENRPCPATYDNPESDLCAQWKAANAASDSALWAMLGVLVGCVSLGGIYYTFRETRRTADAAIAAVGATKSGNDIAADTAIHQLRAYVYIKTSEHALSPSKLDPTTSDITISYKVHNFGQTPARKSKAVAVACVGPFPLQELLPELPKRTALWDLPPGHEGGDALTMRDVPQATITALSSGRITLWIHGEITYEDYTGEARVTKFRMFSKGDVFRAGMFRTADEGNEAT